MNKQQQTSSGFEALTQGQININGEPQSGPGLHTPPERRPVGMVFQDFALLPHLSVFDNVAFGLREVAASERVGRVEEMLSLVDMQSFAARMPHELSGGQQQRVALARSLVRRPQLLLLDEPFSSLDASLRRSLGRDVRAVLGQLGMTALFVTHDQAEAFSLADDIGVIANGHLLQWDSAYNVYHRPATRAVASFVGGGSWLSGTVASDGRIDTVLGPLSGTPDRALPSGTSVDVLLRPDDIVHRDDATLTARVVAKEFSGASFLYELALPDGTALQAIVPSHHDHPTGSDIGIELDAEHVVAFPVAD